MTTPLITYGGGKTGKSAYELYVDGGGGLSEANWLDSLSDPDTVALDDIAALQAYTKASTVVVASLKGKDSVGDGFGGVYLYDSTDAVSSDDGYYTIVGVDNSRWKRVEDVPGFSTRATAVAAVAGGWTPKNRRVYWIGQDLYRGSTGATDISDLNGLIPFQRKKIPASAFGVEADTIILNDGNITTGTTTFTSVRASFTSSDVGKSIVVRGAGAAGVPLTTTIASFTDGNTVELTDGADTTVSGVEYAYGTDDSTAFQEALDYAKTINGATVLYTGNVGIGTQLTAYPGTTIDGNVDSWGARETGAFWEDVPGNSQWFSEGRLVALADMTSVITHGDIDSKDEAPYRIQNSIIDGFFVADNCVLHNPTASDNRHFTIFNSIFVRSASHGIDVKTSNRMDFSFFDISTCGAAGIYFRSGSADLKVSKFGIKLCVESGIVFPGGSSEVEISDGKLDDNRENGIRILGASNTAQILISNIAFQNQFYEGLRCQGDSSTNFDVIVSGCSFEGNSRSNGGGRKNQVIATGSPVNLHMHGCLFDGYTNSPEYYVEAANSAKVFIYGPLERKGPPSISKWFETSSGRVITASHWETNQWTFRDGPVKGVFDLRATYGGTADVITLTSDTDQSSLTTGMKVRFLATSANTGSATINLDGIGAVTCKTITGLGLPADYIRTDVDTEAVYDGTNWIVSRKTESGTGSDGIWHRFEDGRQYVEHKLELTNDSTSQQSATWTYEKPFNGVPRVVASTTEVGTSMANVTYVELLSPRRSTQNATTCGIKIGRVSGGGDFDAADVVQVEVQAVGYWFGTGG